MKIAVIGMSHIAALKRAYRKRPGLAACAELAFVQLRRPEFGMKDSRFGPEELAPRHRSRLSREVAEAAAGADLALLCIRGSIVHLSALTPWEGEGAPRPDSAVSEDVRQRFAADVAINDRWLSFIARFARVRTAVIPPPPPIESEDWIRAHPGGFEERIGQRGVNPAPYRLRAWQLYVRMIREQAARHGLEFVDLPPDVLSGAGFLQEACAGVESSHGNEAYGEAIIRHVIDFMASRAPVAGARAAAAALTKGVADHPTAPGDEESRRHPYQGLADRAFWKQAVAGVPARELDPVGAVAWRISRSDRVATAGSCFAQHISKRIRSAGFQFLVTEHPARGDDSAEQRGYYDFSARYGNLYTARQLLQLFERAFGYFSPLESHWSLPGGRYCDPFRPRIEPGGYVSVEALLEDRRAHLAAVRQMFEQLDVLVFTLGLTECWVSRLDGAALPLAPGVAGGLYDPARYDFVNFGVEEVVQDLRSFIGKLRLVNPGARLLLTVSPVPLVATYEPRHVLVSTTYSKSVLRVAADIVSRAHEGVCYFPSYEIVAGHYNRGRYFGPDLRSVTEEGVDHVMSVFMKRMTDAAGPDADLPASADDDPETAELTALAEAACDEELLERK